MRAIDLSDKERLMLANQYEILAALNDDESYSLMAETLRLGHKWIYGRIFDSLSENLPDHQAEYVLTILDIYSALKDSYDDLTDKTGIDGKAVVFQGFDGNNEAELLSFTHSLVKHGHYESTLGEHPRNSHMPTTGVYGRMIQRWEELGKPNYPYTKQQILEILAARIHPENR